MNRRERWDTSDRIVAVIAVVTILAGAGQMIVPDIALGGLGLEADGASIFAFRLASFMILCFGALLLHEVLTGSIGKGTLWVGIQKLGAALLLVTALLSGDAATPAWAIVVWDGLCGVFLSGRAFRSKRPLAGAE